MMYWTIMPNHSTGSSHEDIVLNFRFWPHAAESGRCLACSFAAADETHRRGRAACGPLVQSVDLRPRRLDRARPSERLGGDKSGKLLRRATGRLQTLIEEPVAHSLGFK